MTFPAARARRPRSSRSAAAHLRCGIDECRRLTAVALPGVDFTREIALTRELAIGDTTLFARGGIWSAFALWHSTPLAAGRPKDELRVLKLVARDAAAFDRLLDALPAAAAGEKVGRIAIRCQSEFAAAYLRLVARGYRVHWTDLRMTLQDFAQRSAGSGDRDVQLGDLSRQLPSARRRSRSGGGRVASSSSTLSSSRDGRKGFRSNGTAGS